MPVANSINEPTTGIVGMTGTGFTATAVTNHGVVLGGSTSSTLGNVGPTATSGQVLQSAGSSADPAFSTATYPATTTVSQILYSSATNVVGGITTANNGVLITSASGVPSLLANGTTGQVLTATTGSPPSWSAVPSSFAPNSTVQLYDDFFSAPIGTADLTGQQTWETGSSQWQMVNGVATSGHPGVVTNTSMTSGNRKMILPSDDAGVSAGGFILGGGILTLDWIFKVGILSTAGNRYTFLFGLGDITTSAALTNGCWIQYSDNLNSGNWTFNTAAASSPTNSNSSTAVTTGWHHGQIVVNAAASSVQFNMDGVSLGTAITTTIPTAGVQPLLNILIVGGTIAAGTIMVDLFYLNQTLTTPR